jgi:hypothetical protein
LQDRRLFDYIPAILRDARELRILIERAEQPETDKLWERISWLWDEQFIDTAGDTALSRWEKMMGLPPSSSFAERRTVILRRLREEPVFTLKALISTLEEMCGAGKVAVTMDYDNYTLIVRMEPGGPVNAVRSLLTRRVPANILLDVDFYYARHIDLRPFTHEQLSENTHINIREDV